MTPTRRRLYRQGRCDAMALALHYLTELPLVKIVGQRRNRSQSGPRWCDEPAHLGVQTGSNTWIDVDGEHRGVPLDRLRFLRPPDRVVLRRTSPREVTFLYAIDGVPQRQINSAVRDAIHDPILQPIISRYR